MEAIIGTVIGALIAGIAMIINSHYSAKRQENHENNITRRNQLTKDIDDLEQTYQSALQILDRLIRQKGVDQKDKLESLYKIEIKLKLIASADVHSKFVETQNAIATMAHKLSPLPEEFIPKFEEDFDRKNRLKARKEAECLRDKEATKFLPDIRIKHDELAGLMKDDLSARKRLEP